jgi:flagellar biosynthetic protein FliR
MTEWLNEAWVLGFGRALGFVATIPIGFDLAGLGKRLGVAACLGAAIGSAGAAGAAPLSVGALLSEVVIGLCLGAPIVFVVGGAALWGELFDAGRGESIGTLYDPSLGGMSSTMALSAQHLVWAYLVFSDVLLTAVGGLTASLDQVSLGAGARIDALGGRALESGRAVLGLALDAAVPWAVAYLGVELALGFVARFAPQVSLSTETFIVKSGVAFVLVWAIDPESVWSAWYGAFPAGVTPLPAPNSY